MTTNAHALPARRGAGGLQVLLLAALLLALAPGAVASEPAGRVVFTTGEVTTVDAEGFRRPLTRHDVVYPGETVNTGPRAGVQMRMRDDALIELEPDSRLVIERYGSRAAGAGDAILRFVRGALRTVTGAFGKGEGETYRLHTPVATIGVRGTQYALELCDADCAGEDRPAGLYGRVSGGAIAVRNDAGELVVTRTESFYVADAATVPRQLVRPPAGILDRLPRSPDRVPGSGSVVPEDDALLGDTGDLHDDELLSVDSGLLEAGGGLLEAGGGLLKDTGGVLGDASGAVGDTVGGVGDAVGSVGNTLGSGVGDAVGGVGDAVGGDLGDTVGDTGDAVGDSVGDVSDTVGDTVGEVGDTVGDVGDAVGDTVGDLGDTVSGGGDDSSGGGCLLICLDLSP